MTRGKKPGTSGRYLGTLCKRKHKHAGLFMSQRYRATGECVSCHRIWYRNYYRKNKKRYADWQQKNAHNHRASNRKYHSKPEVKAKKVVATRKIRLTPIGRLRYKISQHKRRLGCALRLIPYTALEVVKRFKILGNRCVYCGASEITIDHLIPVSLKGYNCLENLVPACPSCNSSKHSAHPIIWMERVGFPQTTVKIIGRLIKIYEERVRRWEL